jgi:asparagine synthase (glutamine-hydrolysing)
MAFSIEARVPFLDHRIVELAFSLPAHLKIRGSWTKWVLRRAVEHMLPKEVAWRRSKMGYPTPFARWLRGSDGAAIRDLILSRQFTERQLVQENQLMALWEAHQTGRADHSWILWRCATLELWHREFIDRWSPQGIPLRAPRWASSMIE